MCYSIVMGKWIGRSGDETFFAISRKVIHCYQNNVILALSVLLRCVYYYERIIGNEKKVVQSRYRPGVAQRVPGS